MKLGRIQDADEHQVSLFGGYDSPEDLAIMRAMDRINSRDGHETLKIAACGVNKEAWYMNQVFKSPRYLTGWNELLKI